MSLFDLGYSTTPTSPGTAPNSSTVANPQAQLDALTQALANAQAQQSQYDTASAAYNKQAPAYAAYTAQNPTDPYGDAIRSAYQMAGLAAPGQGAVDYFTNDIQSGTHNWNDLAATLKGAGGSQITPSASWIQPQSQSDFLKYQPDNSMWSNPANQGSLLSGFMHAINSGGMGQDAYQWGIGHPGQINPASINPGMAPKAPNPNAVGDATNALSGFQSNLKTGQDAYANMTGTPGGMVSGMSTNSNGTPFYSGTNAAGGNGGSDPGFGSYQSLQKQAQQTQPWSQNDPWGGAFTSGWRS